MEELEVRAEEYPITRAFLNFITALAPHISTTQPISIPSTGWKDTDAAVMEATEAERLFGLTGPNLGRSTKVGPMASYISNLSPQALLTSLVNWVTINVFQKHAMRVYKYPDEQVILCVMIILFNFSNFHVFIA
ncbi:unnamed protein product [Protopolystoma xenopodis]|uniref:Uncharacterized protein n=1 Tax=Protopolystoma xenopodis TaxID=117903 RepID=A0A448WY38_9PLAT|nr:unnamed protein product [Protopolystoma xenopodis]